MEQGGAARAVLGDLYSRAERGDYKVLVKALDSRFETGNRAEMYHATLKSKPGGKTSPCLSWLTPLEDLPATPFHASRVAFETP